MKFAIFSDTAGAKVYDLVVELREYLEDKVIEKYKDNTLNIGIVVRCLPESYGRKSFTRYVNAENDLTVDFCVIVEDYEQMYKIQQRFELGNLFLQWLIKGLANKNLQKNNPDFNTEDFIKDIKNWGLERGWFVESIDWSLDLDT